MKTRSCFLEFLCFVLLLFAAQPFPLSMAHADEGNSGIASTAAHPAEHTENVPDDDDAPVTSDLLTPPVVNNSQLLALDWPAITLLGEQVSPGQRREIGLRLTESFAGSVVETKVHVLHGTAPGPAVCLTGGIHGDEINGMEIVRRVIERLDVDAIHGTVIGVPIVNLLGFQRSSRYLPDRRDLNRFFPGNPFGSSASRIAHLLFRHVIRECDALVDYHTGSLHRTNLPQVRGDLRDAAVQRLAQKFTGGVVVHNRPKKGTIRRAAMDAGIPAIIYEAGEPMRLQEEEIERGVLGTLDMLSALGLLEREPSTTAPAQVYYETRWVRANDGGILRAEVQLGDTVSAGTVLGRITDPVHKERTELLSNHSGRVIGMTVSPIMIPGYAAFHIGIDLPSSQSDEPNEPRTQRDPVYSEGDLDETEDERPE